MGVLIMALIDGIEPCIMKSLVPLTTTHIATAYGIFEALECGAKTFGGPLIGFLRDEFGDYGVDLAIFSALLMTAVIFGAWTVLISEPTKRKRRSYRSSRGHSHGRG